MNLTPWPVLPGHPHAGQTLPAFLSPAGQLQVSCAKVAFGPAHWISPLQCTMPSTDAGPRPPALGWLRDGEEWELSVERANDPWGETELGGTMRFPATGQANGVQVAERAAGSDSAESATAGGVANATGFAGAGGVASNVGRVGEAAGDAAPALLHEFTQAAFTAMTSRVTVPVLHEAVAIPSAWGLVTIHVPWQGSVARIIEQEPLTISTEGSERQIRRADIILDADPLALAGHLMWDADGIVSWPRANGATDGDLVAAIAPLLPALG
ncbi:MAG: hypothetical protein Q4B12_01745 [Bowdeniella nasicola]|nr:hypothetical protein [Bowdeniella nasicola]